MNARRFVLLGLCLLGGILAACAPAAKMEAPVATEALPVEVHREVVVTQVVEVVAEQAVEAEAPAAVGAEALGTPVSYKGAEMFALAPEEGPNRLIIKNAEMRLLVEDTDTAIDRTTQVVADVGGYIISSRVWYEERWGETHKFSTITMGVPVDDFERAMRRLRDLSMQVLDENATGEDVTDEYVDLDSRLKNLEATRDRIREFLAEAKTVQDALKVNEELSKVEEEIEKVQGRMNYLFDRAAYSTITVNLEPEIIEPTPTITPSPTPTATPTQTSTPTVTPTPTPWKPGETFQAASSTFGEMFRSLVNALIWIAVTVLPCLLPVALVGGVVWWLIARRKKRAAAVGSPAEIKKANASE